MYEEPLQVDVTRLREGGSVVGDGDDGAVAGGARQGLEHVLGRGGVEVSRELVEKQQGRIAGEGAREGEQLPLPLGEGDLPNGRVEALRQFLYRGRQSRHVQQGPEVAVGHAGSWDWLFCQRNGGCDFWGDVRCVSYFCCLFFACGLQLALCQRELVAQGAGDTGAVLFDDTEEVTPRFGRNLVRGLAEDGDLATGGRVEPGEQTEERRLARARAAADDDAFAREHGKVEVAEYRRMAVIAEADLMERADGGSSDIRCGASRDRGIGGLYRGVRHWQ